MLLVLKDEGGNFESQIRSFYGEITGYERRITTTANRLYAQNTRPYLHAVIMPQLNSIQRRK